MRMRISSSSRFGRGNAAAPSPCGWSRERTGTSRSFARARPAIAVRCSPRKRRPTRASSVARHSSSRTTPGCGRRRHAPTCARSPPPRACTPCGARPERARDPDALRHGRAAKRAAVKLGVACASTCRSAISYRAWPISCGGYSRTPPTRASCALRSSERVDRECCSRLRVRQRERAADAQRPAVRERAVDRRTEPTSLLRAHGVAQRAYS